LAAASAASLNQLPGGWLTQRQAARNAMSRGRRAGRFKSYPWTLTFFLSEILSSDSLICVIFVQYLCYQY
jgi:hypothetical protein